VAEDKAIIPDGVDNPDGADDGYTPADDPAGEELAADLPTPEPYVNVDDEAEELDDNLAAADVTDVAAVDEEQLAEAEAEVATVSSTRPVPVKKNRPTRTRAEATAAVAPKRTTPGQFVGQVVQELRKVSWPTFAQLLRYFGIVLGFVVFMIAFIGVLDVFFGWLMLKLFG